MYICMTEHYKGSYPVDLGGLTMNGKEPKFVEDALGKKIAPLNYPLAVPCTKEGKYLMKVPSLEPVPETKKEEAPVEPPKSEAPESPVTDASPTQEESGELDVEVETKKKRK